MKSFTNTILMIRPANFAFNAETAENNAFQSTTQLGADEVRNLAQSEFDQMVALLRSNGVNVLVIDDSPNPPKPDAVFPNNWFSTHSGRIVIYPMYAQSRRIERRKDIIDKLIEMNKYSSIIDYTIHEEELQILEGTGSLILDRDAKIAYACTSVRTIEKLFLQWCRDFGYQPMSFLAKDRNNQEIYHTNVMMALGSDYAVICLESIKDLTDRQKVTESLIQTGKEIIPITYQQMEQFAGNMLQVLSEDGKPLLVMSKSAYNSLEDDQLESLNVKAEIITPDIQTIETLGGGSVRCMMAEIFK